MDTLTVQVDRDKAAELYRDYKKHAHYSKPFDQECMRAYQLIAAGRMIIQALESVRLAGPKTEGADAGFPKLALCRADATACTAAFGHDGSLGMTADNYHPPWRNRVQNRSICSWPEGTWPRPINGHWRATALVPTPPLNLRPKRGLANYTTLWEAEWTKVPPHDPMLLRRIGKGDLWLVVCHWDLTPVERAALSTRL
jgi:hypothetical protein